MPLCPKERIVIVAEIGIITLQAVLFPFRTVFFHKDGPAVGRPFHALDDRAAAQRMVVVAVGVIDYVPVAGGIVDEGAVALGPPELIGGIRVYQRIVRAVLPGAEGGLAAGNDDHVARGRAGGAAFRGHEIVPVTPLEKLGGFQPETFRLPFLGEFPSVIDLLRASRRGQAVGRQGRHKAIIRVKITVAVLGHDMARVDAAHVQLHRRGPGALGPVGRHDIVLALARGVVDVELPVHLADVRGEDGIIPVFHGPGDGLPMDKVRGVPDQQGREIGERRMRHVEIVPVPQDGRVGVVAREDAGLEGRRLGRARGCYRRGGQGEENRT